MAQNITLLGASYADVPAVNLPKTGGGTARFTDVTDTTATAAVVRAGNYFYSEAGTRTQGSLVDGSATAPASISTTGASVVIAQIQGYPRVGFKKTVSVTPSVTAGYISNGTAGDSSVTLYSDVISKSAATYTPGTTDQVINSGVYLGGNQTISGDANLLSTNIKSGVTIFGVTGTYEGPSDMDDYIVQHGTSGIWEYNIWKSGKAECWGTTANITVNVTTGWGSMYTTSAAQPSTTQNYPTSLFSSVSYARADWVGYNGDMITCEDNNSGSATAPPKVYPVSPQSKSNHQGHVRYYARGTVSSSWTG